MASSRAKHRLQFAAAILGTVGAIYGVSWLIKPHPPAPPKAFAPPPPPAPPIIPRVDPALSSTAAKPSADLELIAAAREGDLAAVQKLYREGILLDGTIVAAAASGNRALVAWLLDKGADVHESEADHEAPLLAADASEDVVKLLLARGAREPSLELAVMAVAPNAVARRLAAGEAATSALLVALIDAEAHFAKRQIVMEELVAAGARVDADALTKILALSDVTERDALLTVVLKGHLEPGATAHALASSESISPAIVQKLAAKGVAWFWHDGEVDADVPLFFAIEQENVALVRAMLDSGAPAAQATKAGRTPLEAAIARAGSVPPGESVDPAAEIVELLLARGASASRRLTDGRTPLYAAAEAGDARIVTRLLERGARINELVAENTAYDAAEMSGHVAVTRILRARGGRRGQIE